MEKWSILQGIIQKGLSYFSSNQFHHEFLQAKVEFFKYSDVLDERHPSFVIRYKQFLDWYFFSRPLENLRLPPCQCLSMFPDLVWEERDKMLLPLLKQVQHSLFEVVKAKEDRLEIKDLISGKKIHIIQKGNDYFLERQIFDGRVIQLDGQYFLLAGRCFHPPEAERFLRQQLKKNKNKDDWDFERFSLVTIKMRYLFERYPNAQIDQIYSLENRWFKNEIFG